MNFENTRDKLMAHYVTPDNKGFINDPNAYKAKLKSTSCSDELTVEISHDDDKINSIHFEGSACIISTASADILFNVIKGKSFKEALKIAQDYQDMILKGNKPTSDMGDLSIFENIHEKQKNRYNCATLGVNGIIEFLKNHEK